MADQNVVYIGPQLDTWQLSKSQEGQFWKELVYTGDFTHGDLSFSVTEPLLSHWVETFEKMKANGVDVPVPLEHTDDPEKRRATVTAMRVAEDSQGRKALFGLHKFAPGHEALAASGTNVSIFVPGKFTDGKGVVYQRPIRHVALTDYPVIPGLDEFQAIAASFTGENSMKLNELAKALGLTVDADADDAKIGAAIVSEMKRLKAAATPPPKPPAKPPAKDAAPDAQAKKEAPTIAAGMLRMGCEHREMKIDALVPAHLTPAAAKALKSAYCTDEKITISLSSETDDGFSGMLEALKLNDTGFSTEEQSSGQVLSLSNTQLDPEKNPVIADAEARAANA